MIWILSAAIPVVASGTYHMKVGETKTLYIHTTESIKSTAWTSSRPFDVVITSSTSYSKSVRIKAAKSFSGAPAIIHCLYYYYEIRGRTTYLRSYYEDFDIYVDSVDPTKISIPSSITLDSGSYTVLTPKLTPSDAEATLTWSSSDKSVATVNSSGKVFANGYGSADITVKTENNLKATCKVTVPEPSFVLDTTSPVQDEEGVQLDSPLFVDFSLPIYKGTQFSDITLFNETLGKQISGTASIDGSRLTFTPLQDLDPNTRYKLIIPANALKNQWETSYLSEVNVCFKTAERTGIEGIRAEKTYMKMLGDELLFAGFQPLSTVSVYTTDGRLIETQKTDGDGHLLMSVGSYSEGVYLIRAAGATYKLLRLSDL
ncbi:MAG: Ig-like domain-containing protein [Bacteroidaceae bacterium]